jgi:hypothetical protein
MIKSTRFIGGWLELKFSVGFRWIVSGDLLGEFPLFFLIHPTGPIFSFDENVYTLGSDRPLGLTTCPNLFEL